MDKTEFVKYRMLAREVAQLRDRLRAVESSLFSPKGQRFTSMPHAASPRGDTMDAAVSRHLALEAFYAERLAEAEARLLAVEQAIASLDDPAERVVMRERYVNGRSWTSICIQLQAAGYSERHVYRLHGFALLKLKEV